MSKREVGKQRFKDILNSDAEEVIKSFSDVSPDFANYVIDFAYGDLYARKGFSDKSRELAAVACMIGQGNTGLPLKIHLKGMLNVGWAKEEIAETLIYLTAYAGFPSCVEALGVFKEILLEKESEHK